MIYINWFLKLRLLEIRNKLFRDSKTITNNLFILVFIIAIQFGLIRLFSRFIFGNITDELASSLLLFFFLLVVFWLYLITFMQSVSGFIQNFLKKPDMNYLITLPIPINHVFLFKFIDHIFGTIKSTLFLFFPFLVAIGITVNAPLIYYLLIIPLFALATIIPCIIGLIISMLTVKLVSTELFNFLGSIALFFSNIFFIFAFSRLENIAPESLIRFIDFWDKSALILIIPFFTKVEAFLSSSSSGAFLLPVILVTLFSLAFIIGGFWVAKKVFWEGWSKAQVFITHQRKRSHQSNFKNIISNWVKAEWKMASRNKEMLMGGVFMSLFFFMTTFIFIYSKLFVDQPLLALFILITVAAIFNIMAVSIPFMPIEITKDTRIWKSRYWLLKTLPLPAKKVFIIQCIMYFSIAYLITFITLFIYMIFLKVAWPLLIIIPLLLLIFLAGSTVVYVTGELLSLDEFFEKKAFLANVMTIIAPILYGLLSAGVFALFYSKELVVDITILSSISNTLSLPIAIIISLITLFLVFYFAPKIFKKVWYKLEL